MRLFLFVLASAAIAAPASAAVYGGCRFDSATLRFAGTVEQTTACLLRKVRAKGSGADAQPVPAWLGQRVGQPVDILLPQWRQYLQSKGITEADLGGAVVAGGSPQRRYFVIHDTSSPELAGAAGFPSDIDSASYPGNRLTGWVGLQDRVNVIVSRDGRSRTFVAWGRERAKPATKIEQNSLVAAARKLFVHVENVQPRIQPAGSWGWKAPQPGFSPAQEERLALAYVAASLSAGRWLVPAYHFNIDEGLPDGHDDPQNADLPGWVSRIEAIEAEIRSLPGS